MSSGQIQRTPDNFPRMKHRAAGRIAKRWAKQRFQWLITGFAGGGIMSADEARKGMGLPIMWVDEAWDLHWTGEANHGTRM